MHPRLTLALSLALLTACAARLPAPKERSPAEPELAADGLRVMTFNIQRCVRGVEAVADVIRASGADVVALQEVDVGTRRSGGLDQVRELAARTGLAHHAFFPARTVDGGEYGNALLSRFPLVASRQFPLPNWRGVEPRALGFAVLEVRGRELSVYLTHLAHLGSRARLRALQGRRILAVMARDPRPKLLMGDLNEGPEAETVQLLARRFTNAFEAVGTGAPGTYPLPMGLLPALRLDYIFASGELRPVASVVIQRRASDHLPVMADFALAEPLRTASAASEPAGEQANSLGIQ